MSASTAPVVETDPTEVRAIWPCLIHAYPIQTQQDEWPKVVGIAQGCPNCNVSVRPA